MTISDVKVNLTGMLHGGTLNRVRNFEYACERAANVVLTHIDAVETERLAALAQTIHDKKYDYTLPSDFKKPIDLRPQDDRGSLDVANRTFVTPFDARKLLDEKQISIEGREGVKFLRVNWRSRAPKTADAMNVTTGWSAVTGASTPVADELYKIAGSASLRFNLTASGGGLQKTTLSTLDLTDWDELADWFIWLYFPSVSALTSISARWGNDLTAAYWSSVAQTTQADSTAFKAGWNLIQFPWSTATETGTVAPATIDSFRFTIVSTGAISNVRADNIVVSLGRNFDLKYYSQYAFKNSSGTFITRPTSDTDEVVFAGTAMEIYLRELLKACAHQIEGEESGFDIGFADKELGDPFPRGRSGLYSKYRTEYPSQAMRPVQKWSHIKSGNRV